MPERALHRKPIGERLSPAVSVVLPTYDRERLLGRAGSSVLAQTYCDFELIVVDDGSTDGTRAVMRSMSDPRLRYLRLERNRGAAAARNAGIAVARGEYVAFQDSDDEWLPAKLELHMRAFETASPEVGVVYSDMHRVFADGTVRYRPSPTVLCGVLIDAMRGFYQVCGLGIQAAVIRRECFARVGGFDEAFAALEDLELFVRLAKRYRFERLPIALVRYYETDGISKDEAAKLHARRLLLSLYRADLERSDAAFVARESIALEVGPVRRSRRAEARLSPPV